MSDFHVTVAGNVVTAPMMRTTQDGRAYTYFRLASTPRRLDRSSGEWRDGETAFVGVTCWRRLAEHVAQSLTKGDSAIVVGRMSQRTYETRDGNTRSGFDVDATMVGVDLARGVARLVRAPGAAPAPSGTPSNQSSGATATPAPRPETATPAAERAAQPSETAA